MQSELERKTRLERRAEVVIHVLIWAYVFASPLFFRRRGEQTDWLAYAQRLYFPVASCVVFYMNYLWLVPRFFVKKRYRMFVLLNLVLILVATIGFGPYASLFPPVEKIRPRTNHFRPHPPGPPAPLWMMTGRNFLSLAFVVFLATVVHLSLQWREAVAARREAELGRREAELKNLKNQVNPHFLLNTLNNIYALTTFDTEKARLAIMELSQLLRYVLYDNQADKVPLYKEADFLRSYVELMRIRLPESVEIRVELDVPRTDEPTVAPLIFISLVENAFKHGVSPTLPSFIHIHLFVKEGVICFSCRNSNFPKRANDKSPGGIGLQQVSKRLELAYQGRYVWQYGPADDGQTYYSEIRINA